ncbi:dihydropteroate synthase [Ruficoccus amylovorans]|uniref:dihydropteroate synthase n=1 Tax=Ruficoccus amylovorans TaxID=1804625 RepID=A0A842HLS6_9BACT|nr:dihydropteroate synthase [Ruficoccus amylovorans]MBC2596071.1 dihydropteroate synthase [Ruficoccus amylovorans]
MSHLPLTWQSPHGRPLPSAGARTLLMGILNVTPDSFSDGGSFATVERALEQAALMAGAGADVIDVGGESTRPGAPPVVAAEEVGRILPVIEALRREFPDLPLSVDTYKAEVAEAAIHAGVDMINDIWGVRHGLDEQEWARWREAVRAGEPLVGLPLSPMAQAAGRLRCPVVLMHNRPAPIYDDFWEDVLLDLRVSLGQVRTAGLPVAQCWLDPGFGFGKKPPHNLEVLRRLERVCALGCPVLLGTSRKSTIGLVLDREIGEREDGTQVTHVWGVAQGCRMVRVHDVARARQTLLMADAIAAGLNFEK